MAIDLKVVSERANELFNRKELVVSIDHPGEATPSNATVQQLIAKLVGADAELTEVCEVRSLHGAASSRVRALVWREKKIGLRQKKAKAAPAEKK
ncbi:MAG: hypothetical protein HYS81_00050 [Candidatus Aenigmatarchaeota archaeon]|nr:MAG: hypothetical protein HYS81_00050 [Candidatus Aenigmarchaeota archaeon]